MNFKLLILVVLAVLLIIAFMRKLIFLALAILVISFAYYTGLADGAIMFFKELFNIIVHSPPPVVLSLLKTFII